MRSRVGSELSFSSELPLDKLKNEKGQFSAGTNSVQLLDIMEEVEGHYSMRVHLTVQLTLQALFDDTGRRLVPTRNSNSIGTEFETYVDIRDGQSVVLGKSNFDNSNDALFVVMQVRKAL